MVMETIIILLQISLNIIINNNYIIWWKPCFGREFPHHRAHGLGDGCLRSAYPHRTGGSDERLGATGVWAKDGFFSWKGHPKS